MSEDKTVEEVKEDKPQKRKPRVKKFNVVFTKGTDAQIISVSATSIEKATEAATEEYVSRGNQMSKKTKIGCSEVR